MFRNRSVTLIFLSVILIIAAGVIFYQWIVNSEYRDIENRLLPKAMEYNGVALHLDKQIGRDLYLSITFQSTGNEQHDINSVLNLSKIALQTPAKEFFIWVYKDNLPTESIYLKRDLVEEWENNQITKEQFVNRWDIEKVTIE